MSFVDIEECKTAQDVISNARKIRARRVYGYSNASPVIVNIQKSEAHKHPDIDLNQICRALSEKFNVKFEGGDDLKLDDVLSLINRAWSKSQRYEVPSNGYSIRDIQRAVSIASNVPLRDMLSGIRSRSVTEARHVAMVLCRVLTLRSLPEIGRFFAGRDHTTVLHAINKPKMKKVAENLDEQPGEDIYEIAKRAMKLAAKYTA